MKRVSLCVSAVAVSVVTACGGSSPESNGKQRGVGGTIAAAVGGASGLLTGGATTTGGSSSSATAPPSGGVSSTIVTTTAGSTTGTSMGGTGSSTSTTPNGAMSSVGGTAASTTTSSGGLPTTGGTTNSADTRSGGSTNQDTTATGGTKSTAGATSTGGTKSTNSNSDQSSSNVGFGGAQAGAATAGGSATGGSNTSAGGTTGGGATTSVVKKFIGNTSPKNKDIPTDFATLWQEVSMDANSKWGFVQPDSADKWVWDPVDKVHQYANDHGIIFKQHNFFWKVEQPSWVNDSNIMTVGPKWVEAFCTRYPDVPIIDVVNEPLTNHNPPPYTKGMGGTGTTGYDWVITAFKWARQYCPKSVLIINEYNIIEWDDDHNAFMAMMQKLLAAGAEIDAIGAQGHDVYKVGAAKAKTYLDKLATLNLPIYITEFEVDQSDDAKQKTYMEEAITMFYEHPSVMGITHWGYIKGLMWNQRPNGWLVDTNGKFRPAMTWLQDFIKSKQ